MIRSLKVIANALSAGYGTNSLQAFSHSRTTAATVVSGIGALNGWTLVTAEMPRAAAEDGLFLPQFAKTFRDGTPWFGILVSTLVASLLMAFAYSGNTGLQVFTYLVG